MSKPTCFIGIDPGRQGAFAVLDGNVLIVDMPETTARGIDLIMVSDIMDAFDPDETLVGLESNTARPGEVPDYAMRFGWQTGNLEALLYARGFKVRLIAPQLWTGRMGIPGKDHFGSIEQRAAMCDELYPAASTLIRGPKGGLKDGRIDALLIAEWLRRDTLSPVGSKGGKRPPKYYGCKP